MKIFNKVVDLQDYLDLHRKTGKTIGLVPTMGALHLGHAQLIKESVEVCDLTVCSIFVNPTQFNNPDDLLNYPRQSQLDQNLLEDEGCDVIFSPSEQEMYPQKVVPLKMNFGSLEAVLEGEFREGHFSGVGVVVSKLLNIVQPNIAFFGQKDLQQLAVIKKLVNDLNIRTIIRAVPTVRESTGLALSSRNLLLKDGDKQIASNIYRALQETNSLVLSGVSIIDAKRRIIEELSHTDHIQLEYLEIVNSDTMSPVTELKVAKNISICIAAYVAGVRLIDNLYLKQEG